MEKTRQTRKRLNVVIPAGLVIEFIGPVDRDGPQARQSLFQQRFVIALFVHPQPVAQVEHHPDIRAIHLGGHAAGVFDPFHPGVEVRIEQPLGTGVASQVGHLPHDFHRARIHGWVGRLQAIQSPLSSGSPRLGSSISPNGFKPRPWPPTYSAG